MQFVYFGRLLYNLNHIYFMKACKSNPLQSCITFFELPHIFSTNIIKASYKICNLCISHDCVPFYICVLCLFVQDTIFIDPSVAVRAATNQLNISKGHTKTGGAATLWRHADAAANRANDMGGIDCSAEGEVKVVVGIWLIVKLP